MPSEKILQQKKEYVQQLRSQIEGASAGVLVDYIGINVEQDTALRRELREAGVEYKVVKNTMLQLAVKDTDFAELESVLTGSTALALGNEEDSLAPARILCKYAEKSKGKFSVKIGYLDGKVVPAEEVIALSKLPGREGLLSMLLSALTGNLRGLAVGLNALAEKRAEEGGEAAARAEAKAEESAPAEEKPEKSADKAEDETEGKIEDKTEDKAEETAPAEEKLEDGVAE